MRMLALTVLSFLIGSGPLLEGCTAFFVHHHQLQTHHQHPKIRRQPAAAAAATVVAVGYSLSTCSTTRMCYSDSIAPHGRSLSTGKFGAQALPRPPSSSSPSRVPTVALSAVRENRSGDGPPGDGINEAKEELLSRQAKLLISIMIDIIGMSSYVLPGMGEVTDLAWAPISSALIYYLYGNSVFAGLAFVEEIIPGFDVIPTATIAWFLTNSDIGKNVSAVAGGDEPKGSTRTKTPPPPPIPNVPSSEASSAARRRGVVDRDEIQAGGVVLDVESSE